MLNVKEKYKANKCDNLYDDDKDSYISLVHFDDFKKIMKNISIQQKKKEIVKKNLDLLNGCNL